MDTLNALIKATKVLASDSRAKRNASLITPFGPKGNNAARVMYIPPPELLQVLALIVVRARLEGVVDFPLSLQGTGYFNARLMLDIDNKADVANALTLDKMYFPTSERMHFLFALLWAENIVRYTQKQFGVDEVLRFDVQGCVNGNGTTTNRHGCHIFFREASGNPLTREAVYMRFMAALLTIVTQQTTETYAALGGDTVARVRLRVPVATPTGGRTLLVTLPDGTPFDLAGNVREDARDDARITLATHYRHFLAQILRPCHVDEGDSVVITPTNVFDFGVALKPMCRPLFTVKNRDDKRHYAPLGTIEFQRASGSDVMGINIKAHPEFGIGSLHRAAERGDGVFSDIHPCLPAGEVLDAADWPLLAAGVTSLTLGDARIAQLMWEQCVLGAPTYTHSVVVHAPSDSGLPCALVPPKNIGTAKALHAEYALNPLKASPRKPDRRDRRSVDIRDAEPSPKRICVDAHEQYRRQILSRMTTEWCGPQAPAVEAAEMFETLVAAAQNYARKHLHKILPANGANDGGAGGAGRKPVEAVLTLASSLIAFNPRHPTNSCPIAIKGWPKSKPHAYAEIGGGLGEFRKAVQHFVEANLHYPFPVGALVVLAETRSHAAPLVTGLAMLPLSSAKVKCETHKAPHNSARPIVALLAKDMMKDKQDRVSVTLRHLCTCGCAGSPCSSVNLDFCTHTSDVDSEVARRLYQCTNDLMSFLQRTVDIMSKTNADDSSEANNTVAVAAMQATADMLQDKTVYVNKKPAPLNITASMEKLKKIVRFGAYPHNPFNPFNPYT